MLHIGEIEKQNYQQEPHKDRLDRKYPRSYAWVRMLWKGVAGNIAVTPHPIPVFLNQQYREGREDWEPLLPGTRVVCAPVDKSPLNPVGLAVIAYGPQNTDETYDDLRETAIYHNYPDGSKDKIVTTESDPVYGSNADRGREHLDASGHGWKTELSHQADPNQNRLSLLGPDGKLVIEHRLDNTVQQIKLEQQGATVTHTLIYDAVTRILTLKDNQGQELIFDANSMSVTMKGTSSINLISAIINLAGGGPPVARMGDAVQVVIPYGSSMGTHIGTIITGSPRVFSG